MLISPRWPILIFALIVKLFCSFGCDQNTSLPCHSAATIQNSLSATKINVKENPTEKKSHFFLRVKIALLTAREELDAANFFVSTRQTVDYATTELIGDKCLTDLVTDSNECALLVDVTGCDPLTKHRKERVRHFLITRDNCTYDMGILNVMLVRCSLMFQKRQRFSVSTVAKKLSEIAASSQRISTRLDILSEMSTLPVRTFSDLTGCLLN